VEERREIDYTQARIGSVIWSMGYRTDYRWIDLPIFDGKGYPSHERGVTAVPGIYFLGLPWLYTWGSGRFSGVARDARYLADCVEAKTQFDTPRTSFPLDEWALGS
jgi:putative flavoprotein involved in K+ transport